ncbi:MAG: glycosyltransferase family 2 protein, partial [Thermoanaerobaculia bacterium]
MSCARISAVPASSAGRVARERSSSSLASAATQSPRAPGSAPVTRQSGAPGRASRRVSASTVVRSMSARSSVSTGGSGISALAGSGGPGARGAHAASAAKAASDGARRRRFGERVLGRQGTERPRRTAMRPIRCDSIRAFPRSPGPRNAARGAELSRVSRPDISVIVPTRRGGELLLRVVRRIREQVLERSAELLLVDSGSGEEEVERLVAAGARVERIAPDAFDHGRTRDHGAALAAGEVLVFLNQDALPADERWLDRLTAPLFAPGAPAAVQGGILEFPPAELEAQGRRRFFWDSCGPRFYFTRESEGWIARHGGIGFSTLNCAIRREVWRELPFGSAPILEDKKWQGAAAARGLEIAARPEAAVFHSHDYGVRALLRRCASEGFGWRGVGERYRLGAALRDVLQPAVWREWA